MAVFRRIFFCLMAFAVVACAGSGEMYRDLNMDFGSVRTIAVLPLVNLSKDQIAGERVRDVFMNALLATGAVYVLPVGEVSRGLMKLEIMNASTPSPEEIVKLGKLIRAEAVISGTLREYGDVRSGMSSANVISMSLQMTETETGKVVWIGSTTKGGVTIWDRLFGGGGQPMNNITVKAINDLINKLFK